MTYRRRCTSPIRSTSWRRGRRTFSIASTCRSSQTATWPSSRRRSSGRWRRSCWICCTSNNASRGERDGGEVVGEGVVDLVVEIGEDGDDELVVDVVAQRRVARAGDAAVVGEDAAAGRAGDEVQRAAVAVAERCRHLRE